MINATQLKAILDNHCAIPQGYSAAELTPQLVRWLGSPDSDLRENSLSVLDEWVTNGSLNNSELLRLGNQMAHNLLVGIGENGTDSVFLRAFSALILGAVISRDGNAPFLQKDDFRRWFDASLAFLQKEADLRGYDPQKGWAHALAHAADLLRSFAVHPFIEITRLQQILKSIAARITLPVSTLLQNDEEERLAVAAYAVLLSNQIDLVFLKSWLSKFLHAPDGRPWKVTFDAPPTNHARIHAKAFLRSLYFMLMFGARSPNNEPVFNRFPEQRDQYLAALTHILNELYRGRFYPANDLKG